MGWWDQQRKWGWNQNVTAYEKKESEKLFGAKVILGLKYYLGPKHFDSKIFPK